MPITPDEIPALLKEGADVIRKLIEAARPDSDGGKRITPAERDGVIAEGKEFLVRLGLDAVD